MSDDFRVINKLVDEDGGLQKLGWIVHHMGVEELTEAIEELYGMVWYLAEENINPEITKDRWARRAENVARALAKYREGLELSPTERYQPLDYEAIIATAERDESYRRGLEDAALVARAQGIDPTKPPCPSEMVAVYLERLSKGEMP